MGKAKEKKVQSKNIFNLTSTIETVVTIKYRHLTKIEYLSNFFKVV